MDENLINLFLQYQGTTSFCGHPSISSVHDLGSMGETLLNLAVNLQAKKDILLLIKNGADVNKPGELKFTPLHNACLHGNTSIIKILLENGANQNIKNEFGYNARHYATEDYHGKKKSKHIMNLLKYYK